MTPIFAGEDDGLRFEPSMAVGCYSGWIILTLLLSPMVTVIFCVLLRKSCALRFAVAVVKDKLQWWVVTGESGFSLDRTATPACVASDA